MPTLEQPEAENLERQAFTSTATSENNSSPSATATEEPPATATQNFTATPDTRMQAYQWRYWPIIPEISQNALNIYARGLELGNDPTRFSKVGDCQSQPDVFLGFYEKGEAFQLDPAYAYLQNTLDQFAGSFGRNSIAVENGMTVASEFSPLWARNPGCTGSEGPLACEFRLFNPSIAIISLGTNWPAGAPDQFESNLRAIIEYSIEAGVLPLLVNKADFANEGDQLNQIMAELALEYDIPLWNLWLSVQHLPNHGIDPEEKGGSIYLIPEAWDIKSFTALQTLNKLLEAIDEQTPSP